MAVPVLTSPGQKDQGKEPSQLDTLMIRLKSSHICISRTASILPYLSGRLHWCNTEEENGSSPQSGCQWQARSAATIIITWPQPGYANSEAAGLAHHHLTWSAKIWRNLLGDTTPGVGVRGHALQVGVGCERRLLSPQHAHFPDAVLVVYTYALRHSRHFWHLTQVPI